MPNVDGIVDVVRDQPTVGAVDTTRVSPWVELVGRTVSWPDSGPETYHSIRQADYVTVVPVMSDGRFMLVSQYRPALQRSVLELPGGLLDSDESPESTAARELYEETGHRPSSQLVELGRLDPDSGRLENGLWAFLARGTTADPAWAPEARVTPVPLTPAELTAAIFDGRFSHALHLGVLAAAMLRGLLPELASAARRPR